MGMIKLLTAPVRSIVRFPLFQLAVVVAVILFLQAGDDKSARGQMFNGLDELVEYTVGLFSVVFNVKSFTKSWLTTGFWIAYVYLACLLILALLRAVIDKRRNEALEVLDRYRQGLGKRAEQVVQEILDAEYKEVETAAVEHRGVENPPAKAGAADNQTRQLPPPLLPPAEADAKKAVTVSASVDEDDDDGSDE